MAILDRGLRVADAEIIIKDILKLADVKPGGSRPQDIKVHDKRFYARVMHDKVLGLGESYMDGWWDANKLYDFFVAVFTSGLRVKIKPSFSMVVAAIDAMLRNQQKLSRASSNAQRHYNIGNDLYAAMLDKRMVYSCGYWRRAKNLDEAQEHKLDLICRKLELKKGMKVLDIGCGWGGFLEYAARNYGVTGVGVTPAGEQVRVARERVKGLGIKIEQKDYRQITGKFDRIVSIGLFEHIGYKNYKEFFEFCNKRLKNDGIMLHHTIGGNSDSIKANLWMGKYIFPGGVIPGLRQISKAIEGKFIIEDLQNLGPDYGKTLLAWHSNFVKEYPKLKGKYDERFYRMWEYYLLSCAASFRARNLQLWQIVMRRPKGSDTYLSVR